MSRLKSRYGAAPKFAGFLTSKECATENFFSNEAVFSNVPMTCAKTAAEAELEAGPAANSVASFKNASSVITENAILT